MKPRTVVLSGLALFPSIFMFGFMVSGLFKDLGNSVGISTLLMSYAPLAVAGIISATIAFKRFRYGLLRSPWTLLSGVLGVLFIGAGFIGFFVLLLGGYGLGTVEFTIVALSPFIFGIAFLILADERKILSAG